MYAQKIEGDSWLGERLDSGKIDKMSGMKAFELLGAGILTVEQISSLDNSMNSCNLYRRKSTMGAMNRYVNESHGN